MTQIHFQEVLAILEDIGMARLNLSLEYHQYEKHPPAEVMRRIAAKYGHGDVTMNKVDLLYYKTLDAKPLTMGAPRHPPKHEDSLCWYKAYDEAIARRPAQHSVVHGHAAQGSQQTPVKRH